MTAPRPVTRRLLIWTERSLLAAAGLFLAGWTAVTLEARLYEWRQERRLARLSETSAGLLRPDRTAVRSSMPADAGRRMRVRSPAAAVSTDGLIGRIELPRLRLRAIVAEGVSSRTLRRAVGHLPGTALPGESGNVVLAGHRDTFFRPLKDVRTGDAIRLVTPAGRFDYVVEDTDVVEPSRGDVLDPTAAPTLTLITCYPFYLVGNAPERFVVRARQVLPEPQSSSRRITIAVTSSSQGRLPP